MISLFAAQLARRYLFPVCVGLLLAACQTPPPKNGLSDDQVAALREIGFHEDTGDWGLDLDGLILFGSNTVTVSKQTQETIAHMVEVLKKIGIDHLEIEGHADITGNKRYNQTLSMRRAEAVAREIERHGLPYSNLKVRGYGTANPVADNTTKEGRAKNRRVVIIVPVGD
jgi:outer membrane protein OmpA-like peptidoglycan-associated protein